MNKKTRKKPVRQDDAPVTHAVQVVDAPAAVVHQPHTPDSLLAMAIQRGTPMDQLEKLMDLQDRWNKEQAKKEFFRAMKDFQSEIPVITKNKNVYYESKDRTKPATNYNYAELDFIVEAIKPFKHRHGFSNEWKYKHFKDDKGTPMIDVTCVVNHEGGHSESVSMQGPHDDSGHKNVIQQRGSTVTFLQRYTLIAAYGLTIKGADNDGAKAGAAKPQATVKRTKLSDVGFAKLLERAKGGERILGTEMLDQLDLTEKQIEALQIIENGEQQQSEHGEQ